MNSKVTFIVGFMMGALAGAGASYYILDKKFREEKEEEVNSVKETYEKEWRKVIERNEAEKEKIAEKYKEVTDTFEYTQPGTKFERYPSDVPVEEPADILPAQSSLVNQVEDGDPYEITEEEYGEDGQRMVELTYYSDGILADTDDTPIDDVTSSIGENILEVLDEKVASGLEDVYVRNPVREVDYRISLIDASSE